MPIMECRDENDFNMILVEVDTEKVRVYQGKIMAVSGEYYPLTSLSHLSGLCEVRNIFLTRLLLIYIPTGK
jgi:hypothetical protein